MTAAADLPLWVVLPTALLVVAGSALALLGSVGLLWLQNFYERVHAPTLGSTLGIGCVLVASMLWFSVLQTRPVLHEILIAVFVTITTPVSLMLLANAALYRDQSEGSSKVPLQEPGETLPKPGE